MIYFLILTLFFLWFLKITKDILFWFYLWQLKNYHIGRFLSHFKTEAGKKIINNWIILLVFALIVRFAMDNILIIFALIYFCYCLYGSISLILKRFKKPEFTNKILFLLFFCFLPLIAGFFLLIVFLKETIILNKIFLILLLIIDLLIPLYVSLIVLFFQPITVILRNRIINKAKNKRKKLENLSTIGITGSFGKSSVKEFLKIILSESFKVVSTVDNNNSEMGISETILKEVNETHEIFICEMGAYNRGGIKLLCSIAQPKIGIITGINSQHLATFGSQENIIKAKFELIDYLPQEGLAVLNWDSELIRSGFKREIANIKYGFSKEDVWPENIEIKKDKVLFKTCFKNGKPIKVEANVVGSQNIINLLGAISVAKKLGMDSEEILSGLKKIKNNNIFTKHKVDFIDFHYSSNPASVLAHLEHLKLWQGKKIIVMPCLIELGREAKTIHKEIGKKINEICDLAIITTKDYFKDINKETKKAVFINNPKEIYDMVRANYSYDGVVLLEGRVNEKVINLLKK
ncbi:MAG: Mur ligase family protein [Candidatus Pacebacteria bacterium]|nr:Mur ligase family protein [Candidatus Paceibacterota bacterium]